jgi:hypothetical protein
MTGVTSRASVDGHGEQAMVSSGANAGRLPFLSVDGGVVVFASDAANLVAGDTNGVMDVIVRRHAPARPRCRRGWSPSRTRGRTLARPARESTMLRTSDGSPPSRCTSSLARHRAGEPVRFILTDKRTGRITVTQPDLIGDVAYEYPAVAGASYVKRLFDR